MISQSCMYIYAFISPICDAIKLVPACSYRQCLDSIADTSGYIIHRQPVITALVILMILNRDKILCLWFEFS